ncbi:serine hydrolase domain-containing protein [Streptomyces sp. NPDC057748]|uniref:serine hydrolase domain-containing protein n=1 Tax=unclassified Streptomyces TaxID=2593676 RepID=UPI0036756B7D
MSALPEPPESSAFSASPSEEFPPLTPAVAKKLDQAVQQVMRDARVPGVSVGLWVPGKGSYVRAFGVADKSSGAPMSAGLNMRVGSVTKTFTVTALLTLVDQGKVGGLVVEKASGRPLADYLERNVFEPAGMNHTFLPRTAAFPAPHAQGYTDQTATGRTGNATYWNPSWAWAAGGAISDQRDLRTWARVLATGTLLSPATQAERLKTAPSNLPDTGYGLGIFDAHGWIGHNGSLPGYEALAIYLPEAKATLVVLLNTDTDHRGSEPSTLFGEAITRVVTPQHVYSLPAQPAAK